jgi:DNA topoisomerase-1
MLLARKAKEGKLFDVTDSSLRDYVRSLDGGKFHPKDFRTALATKTAQQLVGSLPSPRDPKSYKTAVKQVATEVSQRLGNTPTVALQSYINPTVFKEWRNTSHAT